MSEDTALTSSLKRGVWAFLPLLGALQLQVVSNELEGPFPPVVYAPINGSANFNCTFDNFIPGIDHWNWIVGDIQVSQLDNPSIVSGGGRTSTLVYARKCHNN